MICAWNELLILLPQWLRSQLTPFENTQLQEIRMRINSPPELVFGKCCKWLSRSVTESDLSFCINTASQHSPWAASTISHGYLTASGGHRIGLCGEAIIKNGQFVGIRRPHSLCIRIARDFPGIAAKAAILGHSILILGAPGWGKTTLLRDLARTLAQSETVIVVDERQELFPEGFQYGKRMDVLSGCPKQQGIDTVLRTMGPDVIALDEITAKADCDALIQAFGCGVRLIATAHAAGIEDFQRRQIYEPLHKNRIFDTFVILHPDKHFSVEEAACI